MLGDGDDDGEDAGDVEDGDNVSSSGLLLPQGQIWKRCSLNEKIDDDLCR